MIVMVVSGSLRMAMAARPSADQAVFSVGRTSA